MPSMSALDAIAVAIFISAWLGYAPFVRHLARRKKAVSGALISLRQKWIASMLDRDVRVADASLIGHVMSSVSFFASITVVLIAGLLGLVGNFERTANAVDTELSWFTSRSPIEIKIVLVLIVMVYAFQAFAWAIRQLAYSLVLIGAAPPKPVEQSVRQQYSEEVAAVITQGADGYDNGIRAYHFALAAVSWIMGPIVLIVTTCGVVLLLWRRQTGSRTARTLRDMSG